MELFFRTIGKENGKPIVILHGLYGSSDNWHSIAKNFIKSFNIFLVDLRNHGNSFHSNIHDYLSMTNDVFELVSSRICEKIILIGHSMGGKVAMNFTLNYPDKVEKLVVVDIAPKSYLNPDEFSEQINMHKAMINTMQNIKLGNFKSREEIEIDLARTIQSARIRKLVQKNIAREAEHFYWKLNIGAIKSNFNEIIGNIDIKNSISNPVLFIRGENSKYIIDSDLYLISEIFPNNTIKTIPGAGHWVHVEQPEELTKKIKEFI